MSTATKILIVDDSAAVCRETADMIAGFPGFEVVGRAMNGAEAIQMYQRLGPDIVLMDIVMPEMDGIDAVRFIRKLDPNATIVVVSSEWPTEDSVLQALRLGAEKVITKPVEQGELRTILNALSHKKKTVLIVEDSIVAANELRETINSFPRYQVVGHAADGAKAVHAYQHLSPDIVCMDMVMPEMNGVEAIRIIMQVDSKASIVVVSNEWPTERTVAAATRLGAKSVITKPVDPEELLGVLDEL